MRRTLLSASFDQGAAGTTAVVAAPGVGKRIWVVGYTIGMSAAGTAKWQSAANDKTGAIPFIGTAYGPFADRGNEETPLFACNENEALNLTTVTGAAKGYVTYYIA
jgi:hypothetical protein